MDGTAGQDRRGNRPATDVDPVGTGGGESPLRLPALAPPDQTEADPGEAL